MQRQANRHCWKPDFSPKDKVWITTKNWKTDRPSCKLDYQIAGLYKILEKVEHAYQVQLPDSVKVHLVFAPNRLCKAVSDPLLGQKNNPLLSIQVSREEEQKVEKILNSRVSRGVLQYQVSQVRYNLDSIQYLAQNFVKSLYLIKEFYKLYPTKPGLPKYLDKQLECWYTDKEPVEHIDKNATKA